MAMTKAQKAVINEYHVPQLEGNIIQHMLKTQDMEQQTWKHFTYKSKVFKAIVDHIAHEAPGPNCAFFDEAGLKENGAGVLCCHGTGPSVHFRRARIYGTKAGNDKGDFELYIEVSYVDDCDHRTMKEYSIHVPADLELNFTPRKFSAWLQATKKKRQQEAVSEIVQALKVLPKALKQVVATEASK